MNNAAILIVGLGNPGQRYDHTRHNAGAALLHKLTVSNGFGEWYDSCGAHVANGTLCGISILAVRPDAAMNISGPCVAALLRKFDLRSDSLVVLHDDLDLPLG